MVEPLAVAIKSRPSILKLPLNSMARRSRRPFPADFFSPLPRQCKGKERAVEPPLVECSQCCLATSNSSCVARHSPWCPIRNRLFMMNQVIPRRSQPLSQSPQRYTRRHSSSAARILSSQAHLLDRPPSVRDPYEPVDPAETLRFLLTAESPLDPEHAWHLYTTSLAANAYLTPAERLHFIRRILDAFQVRGDTPPDLPLLHTWGTRLEPILRDLKENLGVDPPEITLNCFTAQVLAWLGDAMQASQLSREIRDMPLTHDERCTLLCVYRNILVLLRYQQGTAYAVNLLVRDWVFLHPFCRTRPIPLPQAASFRRAVLDLLADVPDGPSLLLSRTKLDPQDRSSMGKLLLDAYCAKDLLRQAYATVLEMRKHQLHAGFHRQVRLVRLLAKRKLYVLAHEVFISIDPSANPRRYYSTGLGLYAHRGDIDRAEQFFSKHSENNWLTPVARCMLMHAYAVAGRVERVVELFHQFFPESPEGKFLADRPGIIHFSTVIFAHAEVASIDGINHWLRKMLEAGFRPDGHVYSIILENFARHGDVDSVAATLDQMHAAHIKPDLVHYTSVVNFLARRKDAVAAEAFYLRAVREGITPDRIMITSLMNAHVEAGSWEGVVRIFDYLRQSPNFRHNLSIEVYNTLIKAYVLLGTPYRVVLSIFRKLIQAGGRPDGYTYALVIQSACDAGKMTAAEELFAEMKIKAASGKHLYHLDAYVLTIIMAGHVRQGSTGRAKTCYEEMLRRGIKPSSVAFKHVLQAHANERTERSLEIAEVFLKRIMDADADDPNWTGSESRPSALGNIHSPLMVVYARKGRAEEVARLFNGMLDAGGEASLESLTIVLDVHRRADNIDAVRRLWPRIWSLALSLTDAKHLFMGDGTTSAPAIKRRSNLLCMPLSIYIDALSAAGEHHAVLDAWTRAKAQGFSFDAHNWNHLSVALVRAGELDRAFEVLERVLIPYSRKSPVIRNPFPDSPVVFDLMDPDADMPASGAPMHRSARRARAVKIATKAVGPALAVSDSSTDFAHPLHILHQVIPGLSVWRPHAVTLQVLSKVLCHLQRGRLVQPIRAANAPQFYTDSQSQVDVASATLRRIYHNYPEAVRAVLLYERRQARRGAVERSPREWIKVKREVGDTLADGKTMESDK